MKETGKIVVVSIRAVELLEVACMACGGAGSIYGGVTWCTGGKKWEEIEAYGGEEGNRHSKEELGGSAFPGKKSNSRENISIIKSIKSAEV